MTPDGLRLLAVDDEQSQLQDLARLLRSSPLVHEVECAEDGHDALIRASAQEFDAIFLDVRMPDLDGVELARVLRRFATPPRLVFVSAYDHAAIDAFELQAQPARFAATAGARGIAVELLEGFPYAQVYAPPSTDFICFEPMTAPADALCSGDGLVLLAPGEEHRAGFRITAWDG